MSNFEKVIDFNKQFGIVVNEKPVLNIFDTDEKLIKYRMSLIREEMGELEEAVKNKDYKETVDALSDILYVVYGMGCSIGIDLDKSYNIVHESNMSKLCKTEKEAEDTVKWYLNNPQLGYAHPAYRKSYDDKNYVVFNKDTEKILKSIYYKAADFTELL